ncbi:Uncharacterized protein APZ42_018022 [Daphnia magna]|uniref:Uncharacterized protein n=1 Tax=Daphnia magna TaxID=35525 RepID=A0A164ZHK3_9CRUS|nr:Uncharacterized protein APZ42_018022 [Daphnia magna]
MDCTDDDMEGNHTSHRSPVYEEQLSVRFSYATTVFSSTSSVANVVTRKIAIEQPFDANISRVPVFPGCFNQAW